MLGYSYNFQSIGNAYIYHNLVIYFYRVSHIDPKIKFKNVLCELEDNAIATSRIFPAELDVFPSSAGETREISIEG